MWEIGAPAIGELIQRLPHGALGCVTSDSLLTLLLVFASDSAQYARTVRLVALQDIKHVLPHLSRGLASIDAFPNSGFLVVVNDRRRLLVVRNQTLLKRISIVVAPLNQRLASHIVLHVLLRGIECAVIRATRCRVNQTTSDSGNEQRVVDLELYGVLEFLVALLQHVIQTFGLWNGSGESVKNEPDEHKFASVNESATQQ